MFQHILSIGAYYIIFCILYRALTACRLRRVEYLIQTIHDIVFIYHTSPHAYYAIADFRHLPQHSTAFNAIIWTFSFHLYRIAVHYQHFRYHDWFYLTERCVVAFLLGMYTFSPCLLGYNYFFLSAPFVLEYFILFLHENNWRAPLIQQWIGKWIRQPLCYVNHILTLLYMYYYTTRFDIHWWCGAIGIFLVYDTNEYYKRLLMV